MNYYDLDIHKRYSVYTQMDSGGQILAQGRVDRVDNDREALAGIIGAAPDRAKVAMEATGSWYWLYEFLEGTAAVVLAHPLKTRAIAEARVKTDKVDATILAHLLRTDLLPTAYIPPREVRDSRELLRYRAALVRIRTAVKNRVHALLVKNRLLPRCSDVFGRQGRAWLTTLELRPVYGHALQGFLTVLDVLEEQIRQATTRINAQAKASAEAQLLTTLPGIGHYSALLLLSEIGDVRRFPDARHLVSYAGLTPSVCASGGSVRYGCITKQGSTWLRWILTEAAQVAARKEGKLREFYRRIARRKGHKTAIIALARQMLTIIYHMLRRKEPYREASGISVGNMARVP